MKKVVYTMLVASLALFSCGGEEKKDDKKKDGKEEKKEEVVENQGPVTYKANKMESAIEWTGYKGDDPSNDAHTGILLLDGGEFILEGNKITKGMFKIDMSTMAETTEGANEEYSAKLIGHLGNEDFFNVGTHGYADFALMSATETEAKGSILVMGKTINVEFPYTIESQGDKAVLTAEFSVDFSSLALPGMQMEEGGDPAEKVSDKVNVKVKLVGDKAE